MRRLVSLLSAIVLGLFAVPVTAAHADGPLRILITGDSITHGFHGDYTWRYRLAKEFARQHVPVDFVGSYRKPFIASSFTTSSYRDPAFDSDHFARVGLQLVSLKDTIHDEVVAQQPDVVIMAAGVNDMLHGASPEETLARMQEFVTNARSAKPDVRFVLSPVLDIDRVSPAEANTKIRRYNELVAASVATMSTEESPITLADTTHGWRPTNTYYSIDGIHLGTTGETFMASRIAEHLHVLDILPHAPSIYRVMPWTRTLRPRVKVTGTRATITWFNEGITGADVYSHRYGQSVYHYHSGGRAVASVGRRHTTYTFRLRLKRSRVWGPWGPLVTVRVP